MDDAFGRNTAQVEWVLARLRTLPPAEWKSLQDAHAGSPTKDAAEEALAGMLAAEGLREAWFTLRHAAKEVARKAAADYAAETGEGVRTIEHVAAVNAWDGQRETSKLEVLGPAHELGFIDAAAAALGVVMSRPYVSERDFTRFWKVYLPVLGLPRQ
jgi:hypothetical protein